MAPAQFERALRWLEMAMELESYESQTARWPSSGRVILAQYDADSVVVYQAYRPVIGHFAAAHGYFGGEFKLGRMTWIKPNFLWMMHRSNWGRSEGQEVVLSIRLRREAFDHILALAVHSSYRAAVYPSREEWREQVRKSDVRLQWDPDHAPTGEKLERRAVQLGLRGEATASYALDWILDIEDISSLVAEQRPSAMTRDFERLLTPRERVYPVPPDTARRLECDVAPE